MLTMPGPEKTTSELSLMPLQSQVAREFITLRDFQIQAAVVPLDARPSPP